MENRSFTYDVLKEIQNRWSPRAFDAQKEVSREDLMALMEAARYAPSCMNEQPWSYIVGQRGSTVFAGIEAALSDSNVEWAANASALMVILSKEQFSHNERSNRWHLFDAGTSWGYLSLEAQKRGLITHAMGGFAADQIRTTFAVPNGVAVIAAVAIGYYGRREDLSEALAAREKPSPRKPLDEMLFVPLED